MPSAWFDEAIDELVQFATGFAQGSLKVERLPAVIGRAMEIVERIRSQTGAGKRVLCIALMNKLIDVTDFPLLPEWLADPVCKAIVPGIVDALAGASKGDLRINERTPE